MKSLYESILSTNNASVANDVRKWISDVSNFKDGREKIIEVTPSNKGFDVIIHVSVINPYLTIDDLKNGDFPYKINSIINDLGQQFVISIRNCTIHSFKNFPNHRKFRFLGCAIDDISELPESCKEVEFAPLSRVKSNYIGRCEGLKIDKWLSDGKGYSFAVNRFKNNTIKDFCLSCCGFNEQAAPQVVDEIIKNNNINPEDITVMFDNTYKSRKINRGRVEKKKGEYVIVKDPKRHQEIYNG